MALTDKLTSIADAIREKGGTTEKLTLDAMPTAIAALPTGGGEDGVPNPILLTGDVSKTFSNNKWNWILENYGDRLLIKDAENLSSLFYKTITTEPIVISNPITTTESVGGSYLLSESNVVINSEAIENVVFKEIAYIFSKYQGKTTPSINCDNTIDSGITASKIFSEAKFVETAGAIKNLKLSSSGLTDWFKNAERLRYLPVFENFDATKLNATKTAMVYDLFSYCYSLRSIPEDFLKKFYTNGTSSSYCGYNRMFINDYALDEIRGLYPVPGTLTSNVFNQFFSHNYHLKSFVFATQDDGTPFVRSWKGQTISFINYIGWAGYSNADKNLTINYNSGITADKEVVSAADYERLKDDPDWWSRNFNFSRFGHNAAVELINSLPDTSAYIEAQGASNNIVKFYSNAGNAIDGGGVNHLTEEEIAVAAAKGWSIAYGT